MKHVISFILFIGWLAGIAIAKGTISTLVAFVFPLWAWYLVVEHFLVF